MAPSPFSHQALASTMAASVPASTSPHLTSAHEVVALAVHAAMANAGYRIVGLGEDDRIEQQSAAADAPRVRLPQSWNGRPTVSFRYTHAQSAMAYLVSVNRMGGQLVVFGLGLGDDKTAAFDLTAAAFVDESRLPATLAEPKTSAATTTTTTTTTATATDADADSAVSADSADSDTTLADTAASVSVSSPAEATAVSLFRSAGRLDELGTTVRTQLIGRLTPGLDSASSPSLSSKVPEPVPSSSTRQETHRPHPPLPPPPHPDPAARLDLPRPDFPFGPPGVRPGPGPWVGDELAPPGFEDEHGLLARPGRQTVPGGGPAAGFLPAYGDADLYPAGLGPRDPLHGPGLYGGGGGGGMHATFDNFLYREPARAGPGRYDPQAPPGARVDPVGPPPVPGDGRGRPGGAAPYGATGPPNPFAGFGSDDFI